MAFSKDPNVYHEEERRILILATTETVEIECKDRKEAAYYRHRFYALRKATIEMAEKVELLRAAGKSFEHLLTPIVQVAAGLREVTVGLNQQDKRTLYVGRGASVGDRLGTLQQALHRAGHSTQEEIRNRETEAVGKMTFDQKEPTQEEKNAPTLADLGYGTQSAPAPAGEQKPEILTYEGVYAKACVGGELTQEERVVLDAGPATENPPTTTGEKK